MASICNFVFGGRNFSDHAFAEVARDKLYPSAPVIEHQCLHMTYEALSNALSSMGWATEKLYANW